MRRDRIDLIHLTTPGPIGLAAVYIAWRMGLAMVGSFHTDLAAYTTQFSGSRLLGTLMERHLFWTYSQCDRVLVSSESSRELLLNGRTNPRRIDLWWRGVDTDLFLPAKRSPALRERWRVSERRPAIVYVGRLSREKGLGILRAVQSALHRRGVEHRLIVVGDGPFRCSCSRSCRTQYLPACFAAQPLIFLDEILGVLAVFRRESINEHEFGWLRMFADQPASAIVNARAFSELERLRQ